MRKNGGKRGKIKAAPSGFSTGPRPIYGRFNIRVAVVERFHLSATCFSAGNSSFPEEVLWGGCVSFALDVFGSILCGVLLCFDFVGRVL